MSFFLFYLVIFVYDLLVVCDFYGCVFGLEEGCLSVQWVDFNFYGYQFVIYEYLKMVLQEGVYMNVVDGYDVLVLYFGIVFDWLSWEVLVEWLCGFGVMFVIELYVWFQGQVGEQVMMFLFDLCGNVFEFKVFCDIGQLFVK